MRDIPSTPASSDGAVFAIARRLRAREVADHLRRMAVVAAGVTFMGGVASLYFDRVGVNDCVVVAGDEVCRELRWHAFSVQLRSDRTLKDGVPHGLRTEWHPNGVVSIQGRYVDGTKVGPWTELWPSGRPMFAGTYDDAGRRTGLETWWYEGGAREWEVRHADGRRAGVERWWFPSGVLRREGAYKDGAKDGVFVVYNEDGREAFRARYRDGVAVGDVRVD